jgi:hypothetical protein
VTSFYGNMFGPQMEGWLRALITTLRSADTKAWAILKVRGTENRFLQVWAGRGALHAEVVSNEFLSDREQWSASQHQQIIDLGWNEPNVPVAGVASPIPDLPNHFVSWPPDRDREAAALRPQSSSAARSETYSAFIPVIRSKPSSPR